VQRVPEAVVKVLTRDSNDLKAAGRHLDYIGRYGSLELETDDGVRVHGRKVGSTLLEDWDVDIDDIRRQASLAATKGRKAPKLIHKLTLSMPPGTPPDKVLAAARNFAREEFALQHRYALVLHTDEPHPHVHMVVKAVSEQGSRLNIKKPTLRNWRAEFARHLRLLGVAANATERAVRGETRTPMKDGIYRAGLRGDSTYIREQAEAVARDLLHRHSLADAHKASLIKTREDVERGWRAVATRLKQAGKFEVAGEVAQFLSQMSPPRTDRERLAAALNNQIESTRRTDQQRSR
jgi:hypothetical protein